VVLEYKGDGKSDYEPFSHVQKKEHKTLKEFFLTGRCKTRYPEIFWDLKPEHPLAGIAGTVLFYIWLHPDQSQENWERFREYLKGLWPSDQEQFLRAIRNYPLNGVLFGDAEYEKRLYQFMLCSEGYRYPDRESYLWLMSAVRQFFALEQHAVGEAFWETHGSRKIVSNPNHIIRNGIQDYVDTIWRLFNNEEFVKEKAAESDKERNFLNIFVQNFVSTVATCYFTLEIADENDPIYAEEASRLLACVADKEWPSLAEDVLEAGKAQALKKLERGY
jgi:hypothetical protein